MGEIIVGTCEGFVSGYSINLKEKVMSLNQTFAMHSHIASVRCISVAGKFLATGGTDDKVVITDMKIRKEHKVLMDHSGTVNTVAFTHSGTHLLTGSDDGCIIVTRTGNWQIEKIWKNAHGGAPVTCIIVHPSDKLALSIGGDKSFKTWNLVKGRPAFVINLASQGIIIPTDLKFSPGGDRFSMISQQSVDVWTISKTGVEKRIKCNSKPITVQWADDDRIFVGLENGNIIAMTISDTKAMTYKAHKQRVKSMHYDDSMLYSVSSAGEIKVWSVFDSELSELCSYNASCRITCLTLSKQSNVIKKIEAPAPEEIDDSNVTNKTETESTSEEECTPPPKKKCKSKKKICKTE